MADVNLITLGTRVVNEGVEAAKAGLAEYGAVGDKTEASLNRVAAASGQLSKAQLEVARIATEAAAAQQLQAQAATAYGESAGRAAQVLEVQLSALTQVTAGWGTASEAAKDIAIKMAAAIESGGRLAGASAAQLAQLAEAQGVMAGSTVAVTDATRAMTLTQIEAIHINEGLAASSGTIVDVNRRMGLAQVQAIAEDEKRTNSIRSLIAAQQAAIAEDQARANSIRALFAVEQQAIAEDNARTAAIRRMALTQAEAIAMNEKMAASNIAVATTNGAASVSLQGHGLQLGRLNQELGTFIGRVTGGNTALTRLGAQVGGAIAGYATTIGVLAGLAAISFAYEKITEKAREARKAAEEFGKTQEARIAAANALGAANIGVQAGGGRGFAQDIPALSVEAEKASHAVDNLNGKLGELTRGGTAGGTIAGGASKQIRDLANDVLQGNISATGFQVALTQLHDDRALPKQIEDLARFGGQLLAARDHYKELTAAIEQATAIQSFYTTTIGASSVEEGKLIEKIDQRRRILAAFQSGGPVAGRQAEADVQAIDQAQQIYETYAKSAKGAAFATTTFQDALKNSASIAHGYAEGLVEQAKQYSNLGLAISNVQRQQTTGASDTTRFTALADQIHRLSEEAGSFGKDASIDNRIAGVDDQINHFIESLGQQVSAGKLSTASFEQQAAAAEGLRQDLYAAGAAMKEAFDDQITKQIHDQYTAQKELYDATVTGAGSFRELTATKQAELAISSRRLQLGHDLSDAQQREIRDTFALGAAIDSAKTADAIHQQALAVADETAAIQSGRSARTTYAADQRFANDLRAAALITDEKVKANYIAEATLLHNNSVALDNVKASMAGAAQETKQAEKLFQQPLENFIKSTQSAVGTFFSEIFTSGGTAAEKFWHSFRDLAIKTFGELVSLKLFEGILGSSTRSGLAGSLANVLGIGGATPGLANYNTPRATRAPAEIETRADGTPLAAGSGAQTIAGPSLADIAQPFALAGGAAIATAAALNTLTGAANNTVEAFIKQFTSFLDLQKGLKDYALSVNGSSAAQALAQNKSQADALRDKANDALPGKRLQGAREEQLGAIAAIEAQKAAQIAKDFFAGITQGLNSLNGPAGAYANQLAAIEKSYQENVGSATALHAPLDQITALYNAQRESAARAYAEAQRRQQEDIDVRRIAATGGTSRQVDDARFAYGQRREIADLEAQNAPKELIDQIRAIQQLEADQYAAHFAAVQQAAKEDYRVRQLQAEGHSLEAEALRLQLAQQREYQDAVKAGLDAETLAALTLAQTAEKAAVAAKTLADARQSLAQSLSQGPEGTLSDQNAASLQPLLDKQTADLLSYDAAVAQLATDTLAGSDAATIAADNNTILTLSVITAGDAAGIAAAQWQSAVAKINQGTSDIQQAVAGGFLTGSQGITQEAQNFGFSGLTPEQVQGLYTAPGGDPLTNEQRETNKNILTYLGDLHKWLPAATGQTANGAAAPRASAETEAVSYAAKSLTSVQGDRIGDILSASYVVLKEIRDGNALSNLSALGSVNPGALDFGRVSPPLDLSAFNYQGQPATRNSNTPPAPTSITRTYNFTVVLEGKPNADDEEQVDSLFRKVYDRIKEKDVADADAIRQNSGSTLRDV